MLHILQIAEAIMSAATLLLALSIAVRALKGYRITGNANLLFLGAGFTLLVLYYLLSALSFLKILPVMYPFKREFLLDSVMYVVQLAAYLFIMLAYIVIPRVEEASIILAGFLLSFFILNALIVLLIAVTAVTVMLQYRRRPTASTALVFSSFSLLLLIHLVGLLLILIPRLYGVSIFYTVTFEFLSFGLLFLALESYPRRNKGRSSSVD